jgi:hypothetical protein
MIVSSTSSSVAISTRWISLDQRIRDLMRWISMEIHRRDVSHAVVTTAVDLLMDLLQYLRVYTAVTDTHRDRYSITLIDGGVTGRGSIHTHPDTTRVVY